MRHDPEGKLGIEGCERCEHLGTAARMREYGAAIFRAELRAIIHRVEQRLVDFSNIVKEGDPLEGAHLMAAEVCGVAEDQRVPADATQVLPCFMVRGFDRVEQRFE